MEIARRMWGQEPQKDGIRRSRFVIVRNTKPQLRDTARRTFDDWLGNYGDWRENPTEFRIRTKTVDAEVLFRALDTPKDVRNLLSLEVTGAYFNELREIAKPIWDGMDGRWGRYPAVKDGGCTWGGMWADSNPWASGSWQDKIFTSHFEGYELFRQPSGLSAEAENLGHLRPGYYERMLPGKSQEWIDVNVHGLNGVADEGTIFGKWIELLRQRGGLCDFPHRVDDVFTSWDLGLADQTAIFWWRVTPFGVEVLDWYENQGEDLEHYFAQVDMRAKPVEAGGLGFKYVKHWLPHDAAQKTLAAGTSVLNRFLQKFGAARVAIGPNLEKVDGIEAGRWLLQQKGTRFHSRAVMRDDGELGIIHALDRLTQYRFAWDDLKVCYSRQPLHDRASHSGDCWRYVAVVARQTGLIMAAKPEKLPTVEVGGIKLIKPGTTIPLPKGAIRPDGKLGYTVAELFAENDRRRR
jgi:hypothetical protein